MHTVVVRRNLILANKVWGMRCASSTTWKHVPKPTWSVQSLQLDRHHPPADNIEVLAKRACLDIHQLSSEDQDRLRQDVGNMLFMMQQAKERFSNDPAVLYDLPRGVTTSPVRHDIVDEEDVSKQSKRTVLKDKLMQEGAHLFFECEALRKQR